MRLEDHWDDGEDKDVHARFLDTLARRLVAKDIFRVLLGPSYPGHENHFHFDMSPWRLVDIWPHDSVDELPGRSGRDHVHAIENLNAWCCA